MIKHNLAAMNSNRMLGLNSDDKAKRIEKLSSGYRINRSADDAAGLAISEKMRRQIRGLTQASYNAQDGISMVQIADGAMNEVHEMLQRANELSVKASNGTLTPQDRQYIQLELDQLCKEIDEISDKTTFNEFPVLKGEGVYDVSPNVTIEGGLPGWVVLGSNNQLTETYTTLETYRYPDPNDPSGGTMLTESVPISHEAATVNLSGFNGSQAQIDELVGCGFYTTCCTCQNHYSIKFTDENANSIEASGDHYIFNIGIRGATNANDLIERIISGADTGNPMGHYTKLVADTANQQVIIYDDRSNANDPKTGMGGSWTNWRNPQFDVTAGNGYGLFGPGVAYGADVAGKEKRISVSLQVGAEAGQHLDIELPAISTSTLGILRLDVRTPRTAGMAINRVKKALEYVSAERSRMGAYQNRLEHTIANLDNIVENTTAAESTIRDTDIAKEMVAFSNLNILEQAGQAILANANKSASTVLSLLQ